MNLNPTIQELIQTALVEIRNAKVICNRISNNLRKTEELLQRMPKTLQKMKETLSELISEEEALANSKDQMVSDGDSDVNTGTGYELNKIENIPVSPSCHILMNSQKYRVESEMNDHTLLAHHLFDGILHRRLFSFMSLCESRFDRNSKRLRDPGRLMFQSEVTQNAYAATASPIVTNVVVDSKRIQVLITWLFDSGVLPNVLANSECWALDVTIMKRHCWFGKTQGIWSWVGPLRPRVNDGSKGYLNFHYEWRPSILHSSTTYILLLMKRNMGVTTCNRTGIVGLFQYCSRCKFFELTTSEDKCYFLKLKISYASPSACIKQHNWTILFLLNCSGEFFVIVDVIGRAQVVIASVIKDGSVKCITIDQVLNGSKDLARHYQCRILLALKWRTCTLGIINWLGVFFFSFTSKGIYVGRLSLVLSSVYPILCMIPWFLNLDKDSKGLHSPPKNFIWRFSLYEKYSLTGHCCVLGSFRWQVTQIFLRVAGDKVTGHTNSVRFLMEDTQRFELGIHCDTVASSVKRTIWHACPYSTWKRLYTFNGGVDPSLVQVIFSFVIWGTLILERTSYLLWNIELCRDGGMDLVVFDTGISLALGLIIVWLNFSHSEKGFIEWQVSLRIVLYSTSSSSALSKVHGAYVRPEWPSFYWISIRLSALTRQFLCTIFSSIFMCFLWLIAWILRQLRWSCYSIFWSAAIMYSAVLGEGSSATSAFAHHCQHQATIIQYIKVMDLHYQLGRIWVLHTCSSALSAKWDFDTGYSVVLEKDFHGMSSKSKYTMVYLNSGFSGMNFCHYNGLEIARKVPAAPVNVWYYWKSCLIPCLPKPHPYATAYAVGNQQLVRLLAFTARICLMCLLNIVRFTLSFAPGVSYHNSLSAATVLLLPAVLTQAANSQRHAPPCLAPKDFSGDCDVPVTIFWYRICHHFSTVTSVLGDHRWHVIHVCKYELNGWMIWISHQRGAPYTFYVDSPDAYFTGQHDSTSTVCPQKHGTPFPCHSRCPSVSFVVIQQSFPVLA